MFCPGVIDQVYTALCSVLKFGDLEVKEVSQLNLQLIFALSSFVLCETADTDSDNDYCQ